MAKWDLIVDVKEIWQDPHRPFEQLRDEVSKILLDSGWLDLTSDPVGLNGLINLLSVSNNENAFDFYWSQIYDYADFDRVWIATF